MSNSSNIKIMELILSEMGWSSADEWKPQAPGLLMEHYRRALPFWPEDRPYFSPADESVRRAVMGTLNDSARRSISDAVERTRDGLRLRGVRIEDVTSAYFPLLFAWAELVGLGDLQPDLNPAEPLLDLFRGGFQLASEHRDIQICYATGWMVLRRPARMAVVGSRVA